MSDKTAAEKVRAKIVEIVPPTEVLRRIRNLADVVEVAIAELERCGNCENVRVVHTFSPCYYCGAGHREPHRDYVKLSDRCHFEESKWELCNG